MAEASYEAIVLGAGMAGLTAARALAESGMRVLVVEARDRVGGRILTRHFHGETVELGAQFIHGKPASLWRLVEEAAVATYELDGKEFCWRNNALCECEDDLGETMQWMQALKEWKGADCSFAEYLDRANVPQESREALIGYVEGFNAADHRVIGVASLVKQQAAEDATEGDRLFCVREGYSQLPEFLAGKFEQAGGTIAQNTSVQRVNWKPGSVEVQCGRGTQAQIFRASYAIVALPLGVLQSGSVEFSPMPAEIKQAMDGIRVGPVRRMVLLFRERFWQHPINRQGQQAFQELSFAYGLPSAFPTWWTQFPDPSQSLTAWAGGPRASAMADWSRSELQRETTGALAQMFHLNSVHVNNLLEQVESHDWQRDPFSLGSYSYLAVDGLSAPERMAVPVESTLFFAGEHTETNENWGTVHAAIDSGTRAARQVLSGDNISEDARFGAICPELGAE